MDPTPQYVTIQQAAELLDVTATTLRNWDRAGKLEARRDPINGYRLYELNEIATMLKQRRGQHTAENTGMVATDIAQLPLFTVAAGKSSIDTLDIRAFRLLVRQMSRAFRDSQGGGIMERFEEITKLLYCKLYDERQASTVQGYVIRFCQRQGEPTEVTYQRINSLYKEAITQLPEVFFENVNRVLSNDKVAVIRVVQLIQDINVGRVPTDIKGLVYEELIRNTFEKTENQQFFTPRSVVEFMVQMINPQRGQLLCDPACGSGGFLIEASRQIMSQVGSELNGPELARYFANRLIGLEIDRRMAWVAQMNLVMHGDGLGNVHHLPDGGALGLTERLHSIVQKDSLDVVLTNPPFGSEFSDSRHLAQYELGRGRTSRRRGVLFIERCIDWLKPAGRLGIVIEDSVLNGKANGDVRKLVLDRCVIEAVISLPDVTFMPYATAKSSVLFLRKRQLAEDSPQPPIFMAEVEHVGRKPNGDPLLSDHRDSNGRPVLMNDLPEIVDAWHLYRARGEQAVRHLSPKVFITQPDPFKQESEGEHELRFDTQYNHPSRRVAEETLRISPFPTPKLGELVVVRNVSVVPAKQDPDEIWNYIGLANIKPDTGEYLVIQVLGEQLRSTVRLYKAGDILFSKLRPELRKIALIAESEDDGYASSECLVLSTREKNNSDSKLASSNPGHKDSDYYADPAYLHIILRSDIVFGQLIFQVTGLGGPRVSPATILSLRIPLPPLHIQREIIAAFSAAWGHMLECRYRSESALSQGEEAIKGAFSYTTNRLCPSPRNGAV